MRNQEINVLKYFYVYVFKLYAYICICWRVTFDIALVVVFLQQVAVVGQFFVLVRVRHELRPGGGTATLLRD